MIKAFPLDMRLVSLGVVKKLLKLWIKGSKGDLAHKLDQIDIENINKRIEDCSKYFSSDSHRKGSNIDDFDHWEAVEFRSFLYCILEF
jgi:hypothetical protein